MCWLKSFDQVPVTRYWIKTDNGIADAISNKILCFGSNHLTKCLPLRYYTKTDDGIVNAISNKILCVGSNHLTKCLSLDIGLKLIMELPMQ